MSFQYLHTSAKRGLEPGKSGFCCVARDRALPPDLIAELESQSRYTTDENGEPPLILRHRIAKLRSGVYHILSRIQESGTDYSKRNNHLAHHLILPAEEAPGLPNPAAILLNWSGWRTQWDEPPRILEAFEAFSLQDMESFWATQNIPEKFEPISEGKTLIKRVFKISLQEERALIEHIRRTINSLPADQRWAHPFTSCLLPTDQPQDYSWSGQLPSLPLPYEIDNSPRKILASEPVAKQPTAKPKTAVPEPVPQNTEEAKPKKKFQAPTVEIPAEYDRRKVKRRRRPFSERELSRTINLAIVGGGIICIALLVFFIKSHSSSSLAQTAYEAEDFAARSLEARQEVWQRFADAGYPRAELNSARATAEFLAKAGENKPNMIIAFLDRLLADSDFDAGITVPKHLIQFEADSQKLPISAISYPALGRLALIPAKILPLLEGFPSQSFGPLNAMPQGRFSPSALASSLESYLLQANSEYDALDPNTREALESYQQQAQAIKENDQFAPILQLPELFDLDPEHSYIAFDDQGMLIAGSPVSLAQYLREFIGQRFSANKDPALLSTATQAAIGRIRSDATATPIEVALSIQSALETMDLDSRPRDDTWSQFRDAWSSTFVRSDLMEQTILGYTLEELQSQKLRLTETRSIISQTDLELYLARKDRSQKAAELKQAAIAAISGKEWIVISKQSSKFSNQLP